MQYKATFTLSCTAILFGLFEMSYPCRIRIITVSYLLHHVIIFQKLFISLYHICIYTRTHTLSVYLAFTTTPSPLKILMLLPYI